MWKKLLVPHDFSPCAERALHLATELARLHHAEIALLHVSELPANLSRDSLVQPARAGAAVTADSFTTQGALKLLDELAKPLRAGGLSVVTRAVTGDITDEILDAVKAMKSDVLVVGTHGRSGLAHLLSGSVAEKIVRRASVPVITVRTESPEAQPTPEERALKDELDG